jgi:hypothetical protein
MHNYLWPVDIRQRENWKVYRYVFFKNTGSLTVAVSLHTDSVPVDDMGAVVD